MHQLNINSNKIKKHSVYYYYYELTKYLVIVPLIIYLGELLLFSPLILNSPNYIILMTYASIGFICALIGFIPIIGISGLLVFNFYLIPILNNKYAFMYDYHLNNPIILFIYTWNFMTFATSILCGVVFLMYCHINLDKIQFESELESFN